MGMFIAIDFGRELFMGYRWLQATLGYVSTSDLTDAVYEVV